MIPQNTPLLLKITQFLLFSTKISGLRAQHRSFSLPAEETHGEQSKSCRGQKSPRVPEGSQLLHPNGPAPSRSPGTAFPPDREEFVPLLS